MSPPKKPDGTSPAPLPANEAARLLELQNYQVLDTPAETAYDDIVFLASYICGTPMALIGLIDANRQWYKAQVGLGDSTEVDRDLTFCGYTILDESGSLEVADARTDERFNTHPMVVADPNIRFYAGVSLVSPSGFALGTLCAIDFKPRTLSAEQRRALHSLAREVMTHLELRRSIAALESSLAALRSPQPAGQPVTSAMEDRMRALLTRIQGLQRKSGS